MANFKSKRNKMININKPWTKALITLSSMRYAKMMLWEPPRPPPKSTSHRGGRPLEYLAFYKNTLVAGDSCINRWIIITQMQIKDLIQAPNLYLYHVLRAAMLLHLLLSHKILEINKKVSQWANLRIKTWVGVL